MTSPDPPIPPSPAAKRLTLFAPNLSGGGAERTLARLASHWSDQGRDVTLVTLAPASPDDFPVATTVRRIPLGLTANTRGLVGGIRNNLTRIRALRETLIKTQPDVLVSFIEQANVLALLAARPLRLPVVISERTDPTRHRVGRLWNWLRKRTYPRCATLVVLTHEIAAAMRPLARGRSVVVVPNGVAAPTVPREPEEQRQERTVLGVGRLSNEKDWGRLVSAFAAAATDHQEWRLAIVGDGPERDAVRYAVVEYGLEHRTDLPGRVGDIAGWYARADVFALPSWYEGFPNAVVEAMSAGVPVVAFEDAPAVRNIVRHDIDGLLVPRRHDAFSEALRTLIADGDRRRTMGEAARDVVHRFPLADHFARWDAVIDEAAGGPFSQARAAPSE